MAAFYSVFGLSLACSRPLPRLVAASAPAGDVVEVELGSAPFDFGPSSNEGWALVFESQYADAQGDPGLRIWQGEEGVHRFQYHDGSEFFVDRQGRRLWARWDSPNTLEDVTTYLLGPILGFVLRLHRLITLHASAVVIDRQAIALCGPPGIGKSTTAAAFALRSFPVLSDDITALRRRDGDFLVQADCPMLNLWPTSAEMLLGSPDALPQLSPAWDKCFLDLEKHGYSAERTPRPLSAIYLLAGEPLSASSTSTSAAFEEVRGQDAFMTLLGNTYAHLLDGQLQAYEFEVLAQLLPRLSVLRLRRPESGLTPLEICEQITEDFRLRRSIAASVA